MHKIYATLAYTSMVVCCPALAIAQALIRFDANTAVGPITAIRIDNTFVGLPGDPIEIEAGSRTLRIEMGAYRVDVTSTVDRGAVTLGVPSELSIDRMRCGVPVLSVGGPPQIALTNSATSPLNDARVVFASSTPTGRNAPCLAAAGMRQLSQPAIVNFTSMPPGAEIWVDGKNLGFTTDARVSIPFERPAIEGSAFSPKRAVLRAPGFVNKSYEFAVNSRAIEARLETPAEWAQRVMSATRPPTPGGLVPPTPVVQ